MYLICTFRSEIIVCNKRLTKKKSHLISISRLEDKWFQNLTKVSTQNVEFLYVGRLSKEKGIFDLINMINNSNSKFNLSIVGNSKNFKFENPNIKLLGYISDEKLLMKAYDNCNITILPSFTEGYPYVIDESLARKRPVIIFDEISYVVNNKKGIFVIKCQDIIHNHRLHPTHVYTIQWAENLFNLKDLYILAAKSRMPMPQKENEARRIQRHARIFHSYFLVFQRNTDR